MCWLYHSHTDKVRIQDLVKGGPASDAERCRHSKEELHDQSEPFAGEAKKKK